MDHFTQIPRVASKLDRHDIQSETDSDGQGDLQIRLNYSPWRIEDRLDRDRDLSMMRFCQ